MPAMKNILFGPLPALAFGVLISACSFSSPGNVPGNNGSGEIPSAVDTSAIISVKNSVAAKSDLSTLAADTADDDAITPGADENGIIHITEAGTYYFKGEYGGISIDEKNLELHFIFDNTSITSENGAAIDGTQSKQTSLIITLKDGTENTVTNGGSDANAIHIKGSLAINGRGTLSVTSKSKSAVKASREIQIVDATLCLTAENHAVTGSAVAAENCNITVTSAGKDGINAECDGADSFTLDDGYVSLSNVDYTCDVKGDGIQADTVVYIDGGTYYITTTGEFVSKADMAKYGMTADDFKYIKSGDTYKRIASDETGRYNASQLYGLSQGCKGIKAGEIEGADGNAVTEGDYLIYIGSGTFTINSTDDAIHANSGSVLIEGGKFTLSTYDDGITADCLTKITGGTIDITESYEGIEGGCVEITGGTISIVSSDDGINAASDDTGLTEHIIISGGEITVDASGDGLDSNGSLLISGGTVTVHGPTSGADAGLDADRGILINGGTVFVTSSGQMLETPSDNSAQCTVVYKGSIAAGSTISLRNSGGSTVLTVTTKKTCQALIISSPEIIKGAAYKVYNGSTQIASFTASSAVSMTGGGGNAPGNNAPPERK